MPSSLLLCWDQLGLTKPLLSGDILSYSSSYLEIDFYDIEDVYGLNDTATTSKIGSCGFESLFECL